MGYLVNLDLAGKPAVVVGGGKVASRKVIDLLEAKAGVTVVATEPCDAILALAAEKQVAGCWREYHTSDLYGAYLAIAATDSDAVNAQVYKDACDLGMLVNVVDRPSLCSFTVPAAVRRGDLTIAIATDGRCPGLAGVLREELETRYGEEYAELVRLMGDLREQMIEAGWEGQRIRDAIRTLYRDGAIEAIAMGDRRLLAEFVHARLGAGFEVFPGIGLRPHRRR